MKKCSVCDILKPLDQFAIDRAKKDGRQGRCKDCVRSYKQANKRAISAQRAEYRAINKERIAEYQKHYRPKYKAKNLEKVADAKARWARENKDRMAEIRRQSRKRNADTARSITRNRRARLKKCSGTHTAKDVAYLLVLQKHKCVVCSAYLRSKYHVDHIIPISMGGSNARKNLQILCPSCNVSKNAKHPIDFMQSRGFLC